MKNSKLKTQNSKAVKIGLIGCGTIGTEIAKAIDKRFKYRVKLVAISDIDTAKAKSLISLLTRQPEILTIDALIRKSDLVVEAASAKVSAQIAKKAVSAKKSVMIMSVGGIIKDYPALFDLAGKNGCKIYLPSGAICGLDGVKAGLVGGITTAELITRKPPAALKGAPFVTKNNIDLDSINSETVIFEGSAKEAIDGFPANINVACALSIAGIGPDKTRVRIVASPGCRTNTHEVLVEGEFGKLSAKTENLPSPGNPKTSYLAILSAIATLRQILDPFKVGT